MVKVDLGSLERDGYVIVDGLIPPGEMQALREASERIVTKARNLQWDDVRVVGKQFPPWNKNDMADLWGVQHLLHPVNEDADKFLSWYTSSGLVSCVSQILKVPQEQLELELFNLLINPGKTDFSLNWHRDSIPADADNEAEARGLEQSSTGTQWNAALYDDSCLIVVPGSHRRLRTEHERKVNTETPKEPMEGQLVVQLKAGQTIFYNNNILHRGTYTVEPIRQTLHGCMGYGDARAQTILQHNLTYYTDPRFVDMCKQVQSPFAEKMRQNIVSMAAGRSASDVGYAQTE